MGLTPTTRTASSSSGMVRAQLVIHRRGAPGEHQHRHERSDLGDRPQGATGAGEVGGAELRQQHVEREHQ
jgi:hypothetical protein